MTQYKHLITGGLQMFFVHYGSILHLKINILIYIYIYKLISLPLFKPAKTRQEREKSLLSHPEVRSFTSRTSWFDTSKSLISHTEVPCFKAHPDIARSSSPAGESTSSFLSSNRFPVTLSLAPGFPHPFGQPFPCRCRHQIQTVKDRQFLSPVTPDFEFIQHHNPHHFIVL